MGDLILSQRQLLFVEAIMRGETNERAAISAGYAKSGASTQAARLLQNDKVVAEIQQRRAKLAKKTESLQDRVLKELERKAFSSLSEAIVYDEDGNAHVDLRLASPELLSTLNKIETKTRKVYTPKGDHIATEVNVKIGKDDSLRALQLLGNHLGMFKQEEIKVTVDVADRLLAARNRVAQLTHETADPEEKY